MGASQPISKKSETWHSAVRAQIAAHIACMVTCRYNLVFWRTPLRCARRARRCCTELPAATPQHCQQMCHAAFGHETCFCSIWHREHSTLSTTGDVTTTTTLSVVPRASNTNQSMHHVRETPLQRKLLTERGSDNCQRRRPPQTIARESK